MVQTTIGGLLGVGIGLGAVFAIPWLSYQLHHFCVSMDWKWGALNIPEKIPAAIHELSVLLGFCAAVIVGVGFGSYPAYRAARLDPIEALRHE